MEVKKSRPVDAYLFFDCSECLVKGQCMQHTVDEKIDHITIESHVSEHKLLACKECSHFMYLEATQYKKRHKLRLQNVTSTINENTLELVFTILSSLVKHLCKTHFAKCERVFSWDTCFKPMDICLTFADSRIRNDVYQKRELIQLLSKKQIFIVDELAEGRIEIWKQAVSYYGRSHVTTENGCIKVFNLHNRDSQLIYTLSQLKTVIKKQRLSLWSCSYSSESPEKDSQQSSTDLLPQAAGTSQLPSSIENPSSYHEENVVMSCSEFRAFIKEQRDLLRSSHYQSEENIR